MNLPGLYAVLDADVAAAHGWTLPALARAVLDGGATLLQLRAKHASSAELLAATREIVPVAAAYGARVIVNDRADVAAMGGAAGVHVGQDDLSPAEAREVVGAAAAVGLSTHTADQIAGAARMPIDYLAIGPIYGTRTKDTGYAAVGPALVATARATGLPVVAIGGITLDRVHELIAAGASSLAVITDLLTGGDPAARARRFVDEAAAAARSASRPAPPGTL